MNGFNVVLIEPEIPNNTGNIGRLCVATESVLHLVHPLGFEIDDSRVKRAGLDYWPELELQHYDSYEEVLAQISPSSRAHFMSAQGHHSLYERKIKAGDWLIFGKESVGLSEEIKAEHSDNLVRIPFSGKVRSFNLGNAVAMVLGEGMRQTSETGE
jgi:tRNA (cytidine/uridine-2'-O-)-methyltransferase